MQVEEYLLGEKTKEPANFATDDYYYYTTGRVANQSAGFALVH